MKDTKDTNPTVDLGPEDLGSPAYEAALEARDKADASLDRLCRQRLDKGLSAVKLKNAAETALVANKVVTIMLAHEGGQDD